MQSARCCIVILLPWFGAKGSSCSAPDKDAATGSLHPTLGVSVFALPRSAPARSPFNK
jgi:hypothetical protein